MEKKWFIKINFILIFILLVYAIFIIILDPFYHWHTPFFKYGYILGKDFDEDRNRQRYKNDGIIRNFEYDAVIIGTSMTENFKTTQFDSIFKTKSIKVPFAGATFKEINMNKLNILTRNKKVKVILQGIEYRFLLDSFERMGYKNYPEYLYDENPFNDIKYIYNVETIKEILKTTYRLITKRENYFDFDNYCNWEKVSIYGVTSVKNKYESIFKEQYKSLGKNTDEIEWKKNIDENLIELARKNPDVEFIYFLTPYSIVFWKGIFENKQIENYLLMEKYLIEEALKLENISLYSFFNNYDMITNLNNYRDPEHYSEKINMNILNWIKSEKYKITEENYQEYLVNNRKFYLNYDYGKIFEE